MYGTGSVAHEMADGLLVLQHRGQDAAGIATFDGETFHIERGVGLVKECFDERRLARLPGGWAVGHTRYPTVGGGTADDAQPLYTNSPYGIAMSHNGNVTNYMELRRELGQKDQRRLGTNCDVEVILNVFASALSRAKGATFAAAGLLGDGRGLQARARAPTAPRRSWAATASSPSATPTASSPPSSADARRASGTGWCVASESAVLQVLGYEAVGDLAPGEVIVIGVDGRLHRKVIAGRGRRGPPAVRVRVHLLRAARQRDRRHLGLQGAAAPRRVARAPRPRPRSRARRRRPGARLRPRGGARVRARDGRQVPRGPAQEPLRRPHVHHAGPGEPREERAREARRPSPSRSRARRSSSSTTRSCAARRRAR